MNTITSKLLHSERIAHITMWAMVGTLCSLFILYAFLVNKTVMNVVARENAQDEIAALSASVGELEFEEMGIKNTLNMELAHSLGFNEVTNIKFLSRKAPSKELSFNR